MRSLTVLKATTLMVPASEEGKFRHGAELSIDPITQTIYFLTNDAGLVAMSLHNPADVYEAELLPPGSKEDFAIGLQFLPDTESVCVALRGGDILLYSKDSGTLECVGNVDTGLVTMAWSPDFEIVVFVTGDGKLLQMTKDFEMLTEIPIEVDSLGEAVPVSIGWGKKETQFHGSEGKTAAQRKEERPAVLLSEDDDQRPRLSWRGDGNFFVCSSVDQKAQKRTLRIYNRECALQSTSEEVPKLEHTLCWRPSGNLVASTQVLPKRKDVVFFEKNGLRHGEFSLREDCKVRELAWNSDSSVLALLIETLTSSAVLLWTMGNYHYYLKQEFAYPKEAEITSMAWDPENPLSLHLLLKDGHYLNFELIWDIFSSSSLSQDCSASTVVVDGKSLLLTPFKFMNVPPPMSAFKGSLDSPAAHVSFAPSLSRSNDFAALSSDHSVTFYGFQTSARPSPPISLGVLRIPRTMHTRRIKQIAWVQPNMLLALESGDYQSANHDTLLRIELEEAPSLERDAKKDLQIKKLENLACDFQMQRLAWDVNNSIVTLEAKSGEIFLATFQSQERLKLVPWEICSHESTEATSKLPVPCQWIATVQTSLPEELEANNNLALISLNNRGKLFVNGRVLVSHCNSFFIHSSFLIITTFAHLSHFLLLSNLLECKGVSDIPADNFDESLRPVERGSVIVTSVPHDVSLVLQMPRGNLETVCPRALVLSTVREALDSKDFKKALLLARKHRIDMNVLHDHDPQLFFENLALFISQLEDVEHLNLFISGLKNENVVETMYKGVSSSEQKKIAGKPKTDFNTKVNRICDAIREHLLSLDLNKYMKSILTAYVCKSPPDLESALLLLKKYQADPKKLDTTLKYLTFLADVNLLFDVALGLYDFELVLLVAQKSQKDPKEYLPFLSQLQKLDHFYRRFKIDDHLKRFSKALGNLSQAGEERFEEALQYTIRHALYPQALSFYSQDAQKIKVLYKAYGENLKIEGQFVEAGLMFSMCGEEKEALECYQQGGSWRNVFTMAAKLGTKGDELLRLGREVGKSLKERGLFEEASTVFLNYAKDPEEAVVALIVGSCWDESLRVAHQHDRADLIETHIKPGVLEAFEALNEEIKTTFQEFIRQKERLLVVREEKKQRLEQMETLGLAGMAPQATENPDMFSDTSSMASNKTRSTRISSSAGSSSSKASKMSSRNKRKLERKKQSGREGGIFEESFLVEALLKTVLRGEKLKVEIQPLLRTLIYFGHKEKASALQILFEEFLGVLKKNLDVIFLSRLEQEQYQARLLLLNPEAEPEKIIEKPLLSNIPWKIALLN